jgi:hypothetical protein
VGGAVGRAPAVGVTVADALGCEAQSDPGHGDTVPDGVAVGAADEAAVAVGAGPGLGLGSAYAENTDASTASAAIPTTTARRQRRHRRRDSAHDARDAERCALSA